MNNKEADFKKADDTKFIKELTAWLNGGTRTPELDGKATMEGVIITLIDPKKEKPEPNLEEVVFSK